MKKALFISLAVLVLVVVMYFVFRKIDNKGLDGINSTKDKEFRVFILSDQIKIEINKLNATISSKITSKLEKYKY